MKKIILLFCVSVMFPFMSCSQSSENLMEIGKIEKENVVITAKEIDLITMLDRGLDRSNVKGEIEKVILKKDIVEGTKDTEYYMLLGSNKDNSIKIAVDLILNDNVLYARLLEFTDVFAETCTCSGSCTKGCDPRRWVDDYEIISWLCSDCKLKNKTCNKSVTTN